MIRKLIVVVLTLGAVGTGVVWAIGSGQAYLDPGRFYGPTDRPYLHWFSGSWRLNSSVTLALDRGSLAIRYSYLTDTGWATSSDGVSQFAGFSFSVSRRDELLFRRIARLGWERRVHDKQETAPFDPSRWPVSPTAGKPGTTGWTICIPLLAISCVLAVYPIANAPLRRWRRRRKGLCVKCGYNLTGNLSGVCPECGTKVEQT